MKKKIRTIYLPYFRSIPEISRYTALSFVVLSVLVFLLKQVAMILIRSAGRVAITTGDFSFLFTTWQGPLLLIIGLLALFLYVAIDLNVLILYSRQLIKGQARLLEALKQGLLSIPKLFTIDGIGIILYIALIAPVMGIGFTISLTDSLYIPNFISSVIDATLLYKILYHLLCLCFLIFGILNIFTLHGILLSGLQSSKADDESRKLIRKNLKDFLLSNLKFFLRTLFVLFLQIMFLGILPAILLLLAVKNTFYLKTFGFFILFLCLGSLLISTSLFKSFYMIKMTSLYLKYKGEDNTFVPKPDRSRYLYALRQLLIVFLIFGLALFVSSRSEDLLDANISTKIIAHRAGGIEAPENTITGLRKAIALGAYGSEIDIQRSKDGYYIVNHDTTFSRLCSSKGKPEEMSLEEINDLTITDPLFPDQKEKVATLEEMLDTAKDRIVLFIELKGNSADQQMAEDAIALIKEKGMEEQCVLISLKYSLIDYIERNYPEMKTGYLTFYSFGQTAQLNCDYLGLEEEAASPSIINAIHDSGRKVMVWTPNSESSQHKFLISQADYIITDRISDAEKLVRELQERSDIEILLDLLLY